MTRLPFYAALTIGLASPALAMSHLGKPDVITRDVNGRATEVKVDGTDYAVCINESQDECIQPRAAGLQWGERPLGNWPGQPVN